MCRIVILVGHVRIYGNTELPTGDFAEGAKPLNEAEVISVADYRICPCTGCNCCFSTKEHSCIQEDDMAQIHEKLRKADNKAS